MGALLTTNQLITQRLTPMLGMLQKLEVNNMLGRVTSVSGGITTFSFPFGNWLSANGYPLIYQVDSTGTKIVTPASTDLVNGIITIASAETGFDVYCSTKFNYFSNTDLQYFYYMAMDSLNNVAPFSSFYLDNDGVLNNTTPNYPADMEFFLTNQAYRLCISTLMGDLMTANARLIFTNLQDFSSFLQSKISEFDNYFNAIKPTLKGRRFISAKSTSIGKFAVPSRVNESSFQQYTVMKGTT